MKGLLIIASLITIALSLTPQENGLLLNLTKIDGPIGKDSYKVALQNPKIVRVTGWYSAVDFLPASKTLGSAYDVRDPATDNTLGQYTVWNPIPIGMAPGTTLNFNLIAVG